MVAWRYLRARRKEGFISVIAGFSFLGIVLGVATLIVVMSVMNGFRNDLLDKISASTANVPASRSTTPLTDYDAVAERVDARSRASRSRCRWSRARRFASSPYGSRAACSCAACARPTSEALPGVAGNITQGTLEGFDTGGGVAIGARARRAL